MPAKGEARPDSHGVLRRSVETQVVTRDAAYGIRRTISIRTRRRVGDRSFGIATSLRSGCRRGVRKQAPYCGTGHEEGDDEQRHRDEAAEAHGIAEDDVDQFEHDELATGRDHP